MREREQLAFGRRQYISRQTLVRGDFAACSLGDLQSPKRKVARNLCKRHTWMESRYSRSCSVCGLVEDIEPQL